MKKYISFIFLFITIISFNTVLANGITAKSNTVIAVDSDSNIILYSKNIDKKIYPASTTKILTAIIAIENLDLGKSVVASKTAVSIPWDSSSIYLKEGEIMTVEELLYGLLLDSGNDAANVLAEAVSGNITSFVDVMNKKAKEIGCTNTHFANAHGYSNKNHYTTARDMAKIFSYCIKNETFVKIISTKRFIINETNKTKEKRYLFNTNRLIQTKEDSIYSRYYKYCVGGKTGYTDDAGRCLITFGKKDDKTVVIGVFGANPGTLIDERYTDAINLFEYSFNNFNKIKIADANILHYTYINMEKELSYSLYLKDDVNVLLKSKDDIEKVSYEINIIDSKLSNLSIDSSIQDIAVGNILFTLNLTNGETYTFNKDLYLNKIETYSIITVNDVVDVIVIVLLIVLVLVICLIILITYLKRKSRKNMDNKISRRKLKKT